MKLSKSLNLFEVFCLAIGPMLSALFVLPGIAYAVGGPSIMVSFLLASFLAMMAMFSHAELASAMPKAGGDYFYVSLGMGPAVGTVYGFITWFALTLKAAYMLASLSALIVIFFKLAPFYTYIVSISICLAFISIHLAGVKGVGRIQIILVAWILVTLFFYVITGIDKINFSHFTPFIPPEKTRWVILSVSGMIFVTFGGLLKIASMAEEIKNPGRTIPLAMFYALFIKTAIFFLAIFVCIGVINPMLLAENKNPLSEGASLTIGHWGGILLSVAAVVAILSSVNAGVLAASRYPLALARDNMFPEKIGAINSRFKTPHISIILTGILMSLAVCFDLKTLVKAASGVLILTYIAACFTLIIIKESRLQNYSPKFKCPLYPYLPITGAIGLSILFYELGRETIMLSIALIIAGFFTYWFYGRIRTQRESALLHLIWRITAKELTSHSLETELKEVVQERDDILKDRFDHLVEACDILDIKKSTHYLEFFKLAAQKISPRIQMDWQCIEKQLIEREKTTSTVLTPFLAIPHVIIEGEKKFEILIARSVDGIVFSENKTAVHAVFVLIGTLDERSFHLRALASIAQIVNDPFFEQKWMKARSTDAIRDAVLLSKRTRHI